MHETLYRKYRPMTFADVVGQRHVTDTLKSQLASGHVGHAYLFCGTRGTGKTTCARILAKGLNCQSARDGDPCGVCELCAEIANSELLDIIEIDAASNNGVDNIRSLREEAAYTPVRAKYRVYIIDEVHMLSEGAFNALLKILEEPPSYLVFILATTETHKIPATILSRCQRYDFRRIPPKDIAALVADVAGREGIPLSGEAADLIAQLSDGAMRNALSMLEQFANTGGDVTADSIREALGLSGSELLLSMAGHAIAGRTQDCFELLGRAYDDGVDLAGFVDQLTSLFRDILLYKTAGQEFRLMGIGYGYEELRPLSLSLSQGRLIYSVEQLQDTYTKLSRSQNKYADVEMCLLRLCDPSLGGETAALAARVDELEHRLAVLQLSGPGASDPKKAPAPKKVPVPAEEPEVSESEPQPEKLRERLIEKLHGRVLPGAMPFIEQSDCTLSGDRLILCCKNALALGQVREPAVLSAVSQAASLLVGRKIEAEAVQQKDEPKSTLQDDKLRGLAQSLGKLKTNPNE